MLVSPTVPFMPLPSSWKVFRLEPCSSVCSLPEEATLLCGERGAWSGVVKTARAPSSSGLGHSPGAWGLVGMSDMERFSGLGWIWQGRPGRSGMKARCGSGAAAWVTGVLAAPGTQGGPLERGCGMGRAKGENWLKGSKMGGNLELQLSLPCNSSFSCSPSLWT